MSTERDVTGIVRSWLDEGATRLPDRVLDDVLDRVPSTPQRRGFWPARRFLDMSNVAKFAAIAAAVLILGVAGFALLPRSPSVGGPGTGPSPSPTPSPTPAHVALESRPINVPLDAGSYALGNPFPIPFSFTLPAGWAPYNMTAGEVNLGPIGFYSLDKVYIDPCHPEAGTQLPLASPTADEIVANLTKLTGHSASPVSSLTVDGRPASHFTITNTIDTNTAGCTDGALLPLFLETDGIKASTNGGTTQHIWVVAGATPLVIVAEPAEQTQTQNLAAIEQIVASITFP